MSEQSKLSCDTFWGPDVNFGPGKYPAFYPRYTGVFPGQSGIYSEFPAFFPDISGECRRFRKKKPEFSGKNP